MGSDDLFNRRKAKAAELSRRKPVRGPYEKVLIVCEGSKTEPLYFEELVDHYEIHSANICVSGDCGSDPVSVVQHGFQLYLDEKKADSGPFDRVYCVIDKDAHQNYDQALKMLASAKPNDTFFVPTQFRALNTGFCYTLLTQQNRTWLVAEQVQGRQFSKS